MRPPHSGVAQSAEHSAVNRRVVGSSPTPRAEKRAARGRLSLVPGRARMSGSCHICRFDDVSSQDARDKSPLAGAGVLCVGSRMPARTKREVHMRKQAMTAALLVALFAAPTRAGAQEPPPPATSFEKVTLDDFPGEPMNLAVLPDGRVLHTTRQGEVRLYNPRNGLNTLAAHAGRLPARRGRAAERRGRPELRDQPLGLRVLLAAAEHAGGRPEHAGDQRGRRAGDRHARPTSRRSRAICS